MTDNNLLDLDFDLDLNELRSAIQDEYQTVASEPQRGFHFIQDAS